MPTLVYEVKSDSGEQESNVLKIIKEKLMSGNYYFGQHSEYGTLAASMRHAGFNFCDFVEVTPFVSKSKKGKELEFWNNWHKYSGIGIGIGIGTLTHKLN